MKFKLKKLLDKKYVKLLGISALANFLLVYLIRYSLNDFDIIGFIAYVGIIVALGKIFLPKKITAKYYAIIGFSAPIVYNFIFSSLNFFNFDIGLSVMAGIQQGAVAWVIAKLWGVK